MKNINIEKINEILKNDETLRNRLIKQAEKISNNAEFNNYLENEIIPIARNHGIKLTKEELLNFEKKNLKKLDLENLSQVSGGISLKPLLMSGGILSAVMLGASVGAMQTSASKKEPSSYILKQEFEPLSSKDESKGEKSKDEKLPIDKKEDERRHQENSEVLEKIKTSVPKLQKYIEEKFPEDFKAIQKKKKKQEKEMARKLNTKNAKRKKQQVNKKVEILEDKKVESVENKKVEIVEDKKGSVKEELKKQVEDKAIDKRNLGELQLKIFKLEEMEKIDKDVEKENANLKLKVDTPEKRNEFSKYLEKFSEIPDNLVKLESEINSKEKNLKKAKESKEEVLKKIEKEGLREKDRMLNEQYKKLSKEYDKQQKNSEDSLADENEKIKLKEDSLKKLEEDAKAKEDLAEKAAKEVEYKVAKIEMEILKNIYNITSNDLKENSEEIIKFANDLLNTIVQGNKDLKCYYNFPKFTENYEKCLDALEDILDELKNIYDKYIPKEYSRDTGRVYFKNETLEEEKSQGEKDLVKDKKIRFIDKDFYNEELDGELAYFKTLEEELIKKLKEFKNAINDSYKALRLELEGSEKDVNLNLWKENLKKCIKDQLIENIFEYLLDLRMKIIDENNIDGESAKSSYKSAKEIADEIENETYLEKLIGKEKLVVKEMPKAEDKESKEGTFNILEFYKKLDSARLQILNKIDAIWKIRDEYNEYINGIDRIFSEIKIINAKLTRDLKEGAVPTDHAMKNFEDSVNSFKKVPDLIEKWREEINAKSLDLQKSKELIKPDLSEVDKEKFEEIQEFYVRKDYAKRVIDMNLGKVLDESIEKILEEEPGKEIDYDKEIIQGLIDEGFFTRKVDSKDELEPVKDLKIIYDSKKDEKTGKIIKGDKTSPFNGVLKGNNNIYIIVVDSEGNMFGGYVASEIETAYVVESRQNYTFSIRNSCRVVKKDGKYEYDKPLKYMPTDKGRFVTIGYERPWAFAFGYDCSFNSTQTDIAIVRFNSGEKSFCKLDKRSMNGELFNFVDEDKAKVENPFRRNGVFDWNRIFILKSEKDLPVEPQAKSAPQASANASTQKLKRQK